MLLWFGLFELKMDVNTMIKWMYFALVLSLSLHAHADENGLCDKLEVVKKNGHQRLERFTLTQFGFDNNARDMAIIVHNVNLPAQIQRVTFNRGQAQPACYFKPLAFAQGGEGDKYWGWHMLWSEPVGLFYARMDGEAWVSSNPKRLTKLAAINPQFKLDGQNIKVTWQQVEDGVTANRQALSSDEGRSWDVAPLQP
jgi:hypothetical protein